MEHFGQDGEIDITEFLNTYFVSVSIICIFSDSTKPSRIKAKPLAHTLFFKCSPVTLLPDCLIHASYLLNINKYYGNQPPKEQLPQIYIYIYVMIYMNF